ncbi:probable inactive poly [ADP-ribose] polymerase SRO2 [Rhododendron vialii]|uniref:probable inactive poly [ADP-ribose] polymerase SRO2 n=1 Tax=Rhododendron vialii TaxID=182163 RepID=UPI00265DA9B3|nr:probable inactive poly [ADP-ribose] polymerase SRO2 [Rhododendron vialii]
MEIHGGMKREKSTVWGQNIPVTTSIYMYTSIVVRVVILRLVASPQAEELPREQVFQLSPSRLSRIHKDQKKRISEMEHFGDQQEQVSISMDQNEIPISDSDDDSFFSSVFEEFGIFKRNGLTVIEEGNTCYKVINGCVAQGMGKDTNVAAIHKIPWSGPNKRLEAFRISTTEMVEKCGGNGNIKHAWYGRSRDEICEIISHGFRRCRQSNTNSEDGCGVYLYPLEFVMDGLLTSIEDDYGLRHLLLCNVILGRTEVVWPGFGRDQIPAYNPTTPCVEFSVLIPKLTNVLPSSKMALIHKYQSEFRELVDAFKEIARLSTHIGTSC